MSDRTFSIICDLKRNLDDVSSLIRTISEDAEYYEDNENNYLLPVSGSWTTLNMGSVSSAKAVVLVSDTQLKVKLNAGSEEFYCDKVWIMFTRLVTQIEVENQSATDEATLYFYAIG